MDNDTKKALATKLLEDITKSVIEFNVAVKSLAPTENNIEPQGCYIGDCGSELIGIKTSGTTSQPESIVVNEKTMLSVDWSTGDDCTVLSFYTVEGGVHLINRVVHFSKEETGLILEAFRRSKKITG